MVSGCLGALWSDAKSLWEPISPLSTNVWSPFSSAEWCGSYLEVVPGILLNCLNFSSKSRIQSAHYPSSIFILNGRGLWEWWYEEEYLTFKVWFWDLIFFYYIIYCLCGEARLLDKQSVKHLFWFWYSTLGRTRAVKQAGPCLILGVSVLRVLSQAVCSDTVSQPTTC